VEEQQIQEFVHRVVTDQIARCELALDPVCVIGSGNYSPCVTDILLRLVPCLISAQPLHADEKWWHA